MDNQKVLSYLICLLDIVEYLDVKKIFVPIMKSGKTGH